ncbi:MAG: YeeE/YedE thiosulfate transporter family protein [Betaproteobacteria bacterium]|jgi:uncharacterized membrane protein YedE/YeeE
MQINWLEFTPGPALLGGVILGLAAALYVHLHGRILGISGIISGLFTPKSGDVLWRLSVILGLLSAPLWAAVLFEMHPIQVIDASWAAIVVAGLLIGFGAIYGSGCTSGHGICGLSSLSPRSMVATLSFMLAGFITVFVIRHMIGA